MNNEKNKQLEKLEVLLEKLGYDVHQEEKQIFVDVVVETLDCIGRGMSKEDVYNLVHDKNAYIYVELAYFIYEQGMPKIHNSLEKFHKSRNVKGVNKELFKTVFNETENPTVFDSAFYLASYIDGNLNIQKDVQKIKKD